MQKRAAVIGHPIKHSLSPLIHNHWIAQHGLDAHYEAIDIAPDELHDKMRRLVDDGYVGFNITLPHKVAVMALCDGVDETAQAIAAVNTIVVRDGKIYGRNTDAFGFAENLRDQCSAWDAKSGPALVLGAGGAAKAIIHALVNAGVENIILANRTIENAQQLAKAACNKNITVMPWAQRSEMARESALVVNTTSLGMTGQEALEINLSDSRAIIYDIVYRPLMTPLLRQALEKQLPVVTGLGMLLHQARPAFQTWFDILPDVDQNLEEIVMKAVQIK